MNERQYIEGIIESGVVPDDLSIKKLIDFLCKLYYTPDISAKQLAAKIKAQVDSFGMPTMRYRPFEWVQYIKNCAQKCVDSDYGWSLKEFSYIPIYESEMEKIRQNCQRANEIKLLFSAYAIARYKNCYGWLRESLTNVKKYANLSCSIVDMAKIIYTLNKREEGIITFSRNSSKPIDLKVELAQPDEDGVMEDEAYQVWTFDNLGNQGFCFLRDDYVQCQRCGKPVRIKSGHDHRTKYCNKCKREVQKEQQRVWIAEKRAKEKQQEEGID